MNTKTESTYDIEELLKYCLIPHRKTLLTLLKYYLGKAIERVEINSKCYIIELKNYTPNSDKDDTDREHLRNNIICFLKEIEFYTFLLVDAELEVTDNKLYLTLPNYWVDTPSSGAGGVDELIFLSR